MLPSGLENRTQEITAKLAFATTVWKVCNRMDNIAKRFINKRYVIPILHVYSL